MSAETVLFWATVLTYSAATVALSAAFAFRAPRLEAIAYWLSVAGLAAATGAIGVRWAAAGRLPYVDEYENVIAGAWCIMAVYVALSLWRRSLRPIGMVVLPTVILSYGYTLSLDRGIPAEQPATKSIWLVIHVVFAWAAYAAYTACAGLAVVELLKGRKTPPKPGSLLERAPGIPELQDTTFRLVVFGFLVNGVMIASGAIWAYELWGAYWKWDPVETWSLITWLAFAFYMHARLTLGWRGKTLAWLAIFALFGVMMTFWGVQFWPSILGSTYHLFGDFGAGMEEGSRVR